MVSSAGAAGYSGCTTNPDTCNSGPRRRGGDIVVALGQSPSTWNVLSSNGDTVETIEQENLITPGAFIFQPSGKIKWNSDLLASEPQITSTNPQTIVYHIRPAARWGNGRAIGAADFIYMWRILNGHDPNIPVAGTTGYDQIRSVTGSAGGKTVTVVFRTHYADWRGLFTALYPAYVARRNAGGTLDTDARLELSFSGWDKLPDWTGGPYQVSDYQPQTSLTLVPNPAWYGVDRPTLHSITFKYIADDSQVIPALQNHQVQVWNTQPSTEIVNQLTQIPGVIYEVSADFAWEHIEINTANRYLADRHLREAIFDAINVQQVIDETIKPFFPDATRLYSHNLFPGEVGYQDITRTTAPNQGAHKINTARRILTAAGYTFDASGHLWKNGRKVRLTFVHTDTTVRDESAALIEGNLREIGITVTDKITDDLGSTLGNKDFDMIEFGFTSSPLLSGLRDIWSTNGDNNFTNWGDPASDRLLNQMARALNPARQATLLNRQDVIMTKAFVDLPLYRKANLQVSTSDYINIRDDTAGSYFTYNTQQWGLNAATP